MIKMVPIITLACALALGIIMIMLAGAGGQQIVNNENANRILEELPGLTIISDETAFDALLGTYSWQKSNSDGTSTSIEADSAHPLDCEDMFLKFETAETTATLNFAENPDAVLGIQCWSEDHWAVPDAISESVAVDGYEIELKPGGHIYEVIAEWSAEKSGCGGRAHYSFYVKVLE